MQANEGNSLAQLGAFRSRGPPEAMRCFNRICSLTDVRLLRHVHVNRTRKALSGSPECALSSDRGCVPLCWTWRSNWRGQVGSPKNGRSREVALSEETVRLLKAHRHLQGPEDLDPFVLELYEKLEKIPAPSIPDGSIHFQSKFRLWGGSGSEQKPQSGSTNDGGPPRGEL